MPVAGLHDASDLEAAGLGSEALCCKESLTTLKPDRV